jgi:UDP-N-acetylglucosamine--N-acetylmuramyl-(pentapeptide) pyrophosphoryl-undecaprenol N-acetylglucosamine transferase
MRIGLVGGGTGGHFFPLIAVAENLREKYKEEDLHLYYFGPSPYDEKKLQANQIRFVYIPAGKNRLYSSFQNYLDFLKIGWGIFLALLKLPIYYPDVIFSKGGYTAYPVLFAARILRIPVVIHDSDTVPGRVSLSFANYAKMIAVAWSEAGKFFMNTRHIPEDKIYETGLPIRHSLNPLFKQPEGERKFPFINKSLPLVSIVGGSQGSQNINEALIPTLPFILPFAQVIHQTGKTNFSQVKHTVEKLLEKDENKINYFCKDFFDEAEMREIYQNSTLIIMRGGSQVLEAFLWGVPTILIPLREEVSRDQTQNSFAAMRRGASIVIEEKNLTPHILQNEVLRILQDTKSLARMSASARESSQYEASAKIAQILLRFCKSHL